MSDDKRRGVDGEMVGDDVYPPASTTWVGAFERVMGDQSDQSDFASPSKSRSRSYRKQTASVAAPSSDSSEPPLPNRSAAPSPFKPASDTDHPQQQSRMRSESLGGSANVKANAHTFANTSDNGSLPRPTFSRKQSSHLGARKKKSAQGPAFVTVSQTDSIELKDVYWNHAPSLLPIHVHNVSSNDRILLRLRSDVGRALTFLKRKKGGQNPKEPILYPTNTAAWAEAGGLHPSKLRDIRHLVANLETSDSLILEAGTGEDVFLSFRPAEVEQGLAPVTPRSPTPEHSKNSPSLPEVTTEQSQASSSSSEMALSPRPNADSLLQTPLPDISQQYQVIETHGLVSFRASSLPLLDTAPGDLDAAGARDPISSSGSNISSSSSSRPASWLGSHMSSTTTAATDSSVADGTVQQIDLPFTATYCRPQLGVSKAHGRSKIQQTGVITLDFGDVFVGQEQEMDITVYNQSAIDLYCHVRLDDADNALQQVPLKLQDEAGKVVPTFASSDDHPYEPQLLSSNSMKKVRISLKPTEPCRDYEQTVTFINMHDAGNSIRLLVRGNILGEARDDALAVLSGDVIDFGDCAGGHWTRQLLVLRNNCAQYLDVHFNAEKGVEVNFQLAEMAQRSTDEEQLAAQDVPPDATASSMSGASDSGGSEHARVSTSGASHSSPSHSEVLSLSEEELKHGALAQEFAKTPLAKPQLAAASDEPPFFALPGQDEGKPCDVLQLSAKGGDDNEDDVDASSVASQAGSMPGSPRIGPSQISKGLVLEPDQSSTTASRPNSTYVSDAASSEGGLSGRATSDVFSSGALSRSALMHQVRSEAHSVDDRGSTRSDLTAISQDSRLGPFLSASSSHHGGSTVSQTDRMRNARHGGAVALSGLRNVEQAHGNQLEELILRPGAEYRVIVSHRPSRGQVDAAYTAGKLTEKSFRLLLDYAKSKSPGVRSRGGRERKNVFCRIRTCTSFISVSPKLIDYGAANVGTKKTSSFAVTNHSELTARVDLRYVSKVLSMYRDEISIPPLQSLELRVDFFPRRVNDSYRKQVTVANLLNRHNDEILEVRSKNIDEQKVSFHSLFYRILTSTGSNYLDFGDVNINCTRVRSFNIENISKGKLILELSAAHSEDLRLYVKAGQQSSPLQGKDRYQAKNRYAELEAADNGTAIVDNDEARGKTTGSRGGASRANGLDLKERFLESMSQEMPAIIRKENTSWRTAQKDSHYRKDPKNKAGQKKGDAGGEKKEVGKKVPINLVSALKKGGKGRLTQKYGKSIAFKDLKLLSESEYLDLATGPPIDGKRVPVKSRRYQLLHDLETGKAAAKGEGKGKATETASSNNREGVKGKNSQGHLRHKSSLVAQSSSLAERQRTEAALHDASDVSKLSVDELVAAVESQGSSLSTFFLGNPEAEEQSVRTEINLQRELQSAISTGRLQAIETLSIETGQEQQVIAIYTPNGSTRPHIQGNARKQDSRIFLRLIEFETKGVEDIDDFEPMLKLDVDELPVRELMVKSNICRSLLELSQPHINFGQMDKGETKTRKILIQNRSEWALRFCIRKSGNISSGDIKLKSTDRYGVVPGHGKREVEFVFCPTLTGAFQERLTVENVADRDKDETVYLKANVRKVSNFRVEPSIISFDADDEGDGQEVLSMGCVSTQEQSFVVSNISTKTRTFVVGVDGEELQFTTFSVDVMLNVSSQGLTKASLSREEEEEVEHISQKLKIASRKGQEDKMKKYSDRLIELGVASQTSSPLMNGKATLPGGEEAEATGDAAAAETEKTKKQEAKAADDSTNGSSMKLKQVSSTVTLTLPPNQSKTLLLRLRPSVKAQSADGTWRHDSGQFSINVRVHEQKNTDEVQTVEVRGRVQANGRASEPEGDTLHDLRREGWIIFSAPPSSVTA